MKTEFKKGFRIACTSAEWRRWFKRKQAKAERRRVRQEIAAGNEPVATPDRVRLDAWEVC